MGRRRFPEEKSFWKNLLLEVIFFTLIFEIFLIPGIQYSEMPSRNPAQVDWCENIYKLICQKKGVKSDPTGTVLPDIQGEQEARKIYKQIIRSHPHWTADEVFDEVSQKIFTPERKKRLVKAFNWTQKRLLTFIDNQPPEVFSIQEKALLRIRISKTILEIPPPSGLYSDETDLPLKNEVFYERILGGQMRLRVGGAYLLFSTSIFNFIFTLAHELAHAIDPCELRSTQQSLPAYDRLRACFLNNNLVKMSKFRSECGQNDQMSETFADWVAVQMIVEALKEFAKEFTPMDIMRAARNSVRDLCEQEGEGLDKELYPTPKTRIDSIFGWNPEIRALLGCPLIPPSLIYCSFNVPVQKGPDL